MRWIASSVGPLTAIVTDWKSVIVYLESIVATEKGDIADAKGLLKKLQDLKFVYVIHFLVDYLCILKSLSILCQKQGILISTVQHHVENTVAALTLLKTVPSLHAQKLLVTHLWMENSVPRDNVCMDLVHIQELQFQVRSKRWKKIFV
jgi:hypothetical protein